MAVHRSLAQYRRSIGKRINKALKTAEGNAAKASIYLQGQLKATAPRKSGALVNSVRRRKIKNGYSVRAGYDGPDGFPVARWVNQEFTVTPQLPRGKASRYLKVPAGTPVRYGQPTGAKWTATEYPWFDKNKEKAIKRYRAGYKKVRASLRG